MNKQIPALLSIVVPCFNEQEVLRLTHQRLIKALEEIPGADFEIVYVNDGSRDHTEKILFELADFDGRKKGDIVNPQLRPATRHNGRA